MKQFESFGLDTQNECLWRGAEQIVLPPRAFAVLRYLVENPARLVSHDELLDKLWPETYVQPQVLRTYVLELRKVLGDDARQPRFIRSQPKRGYVFVAPVSDRPHEHDHVPQPPAEKPPAISAKKNSATQLVGREAELRGLSSRVEQLQEGARQVVFVSGDPGMGKTTLLDEFCAQLNSQAIALARGQCVEGIGVREQYYPVMEALAQLCASAHGERACGVLARIAPEWLPSRDGNGGPRGASPTGSVSDLCAALEELAADKPLVLMLEDIHWADASTLEMISALARRRGSARLMIVATLSTHYMPHDHPLRALRQDLKRRNLCQEIPLHPLRGEHIAALVRIRLAQDALPDGIVDFVQEHAEGNPLFAFAIVDHLIAERFLVRKGAANGENSSAQWEPRIPFQQIDAGIPDELAQMIELEVGSLSPAEQRLLEAASLIDVAFPAWAVAAALEEEIAPTEEALDELARRVPFLQRAGHDEMPDGASSAFYAFANRMYREVLYQRQSAATKARRHTRVANRLGQLFAGREYRVAQEMATHLEAACNWRQAIEVLRQAAREEENGRSSRVAAEESLRRALGIAEHLPEPERTEAIRELQNQLQELSGTASGGPAKGRNPKRKQLQGA